MDLSGQIREALKKSLNRARNLVESGDYLQASERYRKCALLADKLRKHLSTAGQRKEMKEKAGRYRALAEKLSSGFVPAAPGDYKKPSVDLESEQTDFSSVIQGLIQKSDVQWKDIGGLESVKKEIKSSYGIALAKKPANISLDSNSSMLFFGPPGNGKTLLAAATSNSLEATFFNVKTSEILSKYFGESSKLITTLFAEARKRQPSVLFIDEIDSLCVSRDGSESGSERRVLNTLLGELDGFESKSDNSFVLVIGATNIPWRLDAAILSRFERRIHIPLPDTAARLSILDSLLAKSGVKSTYPVASVVERADMFSGRDLSQLSKEAVKCMIRRENPNLTNMVDQGKNEIEKYQLKLSSLSGEDWDGAFSLIRASTTETNLAQFNTWHNSNL